MDRGAWQAMVHVATKNQSWLSDLAHTTAFLFLPCNSRMVPVLHRPWENWENRSFVVICGSDEEPLKGTENPQGIWLWSTTGFDDRTSTGLGETEALWRQKQNLVPTRTQGKGAVTPQGTEPDLPVSVEGLLQRHGLEVACCRARGAGSRSPGRHVLAQVLFEVTSSPTPGLDCSGQTTNCEGA